MTADTIAEFARGLPLHKREAYLTKACKGDMQLAEEIRLMLASEMVVDPTVDSDLANESQNVGQTLSSCSVDDEGDRAAETVGVGNKASGISEAAGGLKPGDLVGPFKVMKPLGHGGMGEVWMAEQTAPVRRRVALKVIKAGIGSSEILVRFEAERQALALMNHPNIARILDAGTTKDGQPFFAMELVQGKPISSYCDDHKLSVQDRLELFAAVCDGVQHAHQKGIIHRDLKPGNILVTVIDGKAVPKIIDFGLAKALESTQRLTDHSLFTGIGQILGTLKYMSPEQASLDSVDIDTRADIYALGVILYELLTGTTPLEDFSIKGQSALKVLETIRELEPARPSRRLSSSNDEQVSAITGRRKTDRTHLNRILSGDLDWIVMKALDIDRTRRYESAHGFAADVRRFLNNEPVVARPPSIGYLARKFAIKNRVFVIATAITAFALIAGVTGTTIGMFRAHNAKLLAEAETEAKEAALEEEVRQRRYSETVTDFVVDDFLTIFSGQRNEVFALDREHAALSQVLERAVHRLDEADGLQPEAVATRCFAIGSTYTKIGMYAASFPPLERALDLSSESLGPQHPLTIACLNELHNSFNQLRGKSVYFKINGQMEESLRLGEQLFTELERRQFSHPDAQRLVRTAISMRDDSGDFIMADKWRATWMNFVEAKHGTDSSEFNSELAAYGTSLIRRGDWESADAVVRRCFRLRAESDSDSWRTFSAQSMLGNVVFNRAAQSNDTERSGELMAEAKELLVTGYIGMKAHVDSIPASLRKRRMRESLDRLIEFYEASANENESEKYRQLREDYQDREPDGA